MAVRAKLEGVLFALEAQFGGMECFINKTTGEVAVVDPEFLQAAEDDSQPVDPPAWQLEALEAAKIVVNSKDFITFPNKFAFREHDHMTAFAESLADSSQRKLLLAALTGKGAFRRFKDCVYNEGLRDAWNVARDRALENFAREFLEGHGIELGGG
jgi:hypothetical protein